MPRLYTITVKTPLGGYGIGRDGKPETTYGVYMIVADTAAEAKKVLRGKRRPAKNAKIISIRSKAIKPGLAHEYSYDNIYD